MKSRRTVRNYVVYRQDGLLPEWVETKLEEARPIYEDDGRAAPDTMSSLEELADSEAILAGLASVDWSFNADDTGYLSHDIHPYPAKFIPQLPRNLITRLSLPGELIWDPFGGSGTTALEAILLGRRALSTDANPLAELIGRAKTLTLTKEEEDSVIELAENVAILSESASSVSEALSQNVEAFGKFVPDIPNMRDWFHPNAVLELAYLLWRISQLQYPKCLVLARVCFSKTVLAASYQDEETRYASKPREVETGSVLRLFTNNLAMSLRKIRQLGPLLGFREAEFGTLDLRQASKSVQWPVPMPGSVDLIVTSPPYPNSNDYHLYHRFRLFWLGYDPRDLGRQEIGSHLRHQREKSGFDGYLGEMKLCLEAMAQALRPGRYAVLVLGDAVFEGSIYQTAAQVGQAAKSCGFENVGMIERPLPEVKRSFVTPGRRLRSEQLLVLRKPAEDVQISLVKPPYTLWGYENVLRGREIEVLTHVHLGADADDNYVARLSPLSLDRLRRLTFTHAVTGPGISREPTWQAILENGDAANVRSHRKDPKYVTHGIHAYKGKFYPQLAKSLFNLAGLEPTQLVLDPFCGSGTVLLEAYLNGLKGVGFDLNPLAVRIARAKVQVLLVDPYLRDRLFAKLLARLPSMESDKRWIEFFPVQLQGELLSWFPEPVLGKLGWLLNEIAQVPEVRVRQLLEVIVSSIVRDVSQQDPKDLRIRRRAVSLVDAPVAELFRARLLEQRQRLVHFAERCNRSPVSFLTATAVAADSRKPETFADNGVKPGSVSAIVTSPPYATALPYIDTDRLSILLLLGMPSNKRSRIEETLTGSREIAKADRVAFEEKIDSGNFGDIKSSAAQDIVRQVRLKNRGTDAGFRRQNMSALLYRYFNDMALVFANLDKVLASRASAFFVIGDNKTEAGGEIVEIESGRVLREMGQALRWELVETIPITVTTEDRLHAKNAITQNDIIWFRKR